LSKHKSVDVLVVGGGNAALCAALMAAEAGCSVRLLESAPKEWRGGNSSHTRNLRCMHDEPQDVLVDSYPEEEFWQDLLKVTGGLTNEEMARIAIRDSSTCRPWMQKHGVRFQPSLSCALHTARTNAFFMGGGKALVNAYFRSAQNLGVQIDYQATVTRLKVNDGRFISAIVSHQLGEDESREEEVFAKSCVLACGGFESKMNGVNTPLTTS
jgi:tricarballylate dehydrogenase